MKKKYLMTPGPTPIPPEVALRMAEPIIHHRTPQFQETLGEVLDNLKYFFQTKNDVLLFACSGTGAMEAVAANLLSVGDKVVVVKGGKFGERWAEICQVYGAEVISIDVEWGEAVNPQEIEEKLKSHQSPVTSHQSKPIKAVFTTLCETSTGTLTNIQEIGNIIKNNKAILIVDAISGLGADDLQTDNWNVDVAVAGSQKGLMLPPGLSCVSLSKKAWASMENELPSYYFNFKKYKKVLVKPDTPFTPAISLIIGLRESLRLIRKEGLKNVLARHRQLAAATRAGIQEIGLQLFSKKPSSAVTAVQSPVNINSSKLISIMRDKFGVWIADGQAELKGKLFRIAHLGYIEKFDTIIALSALEMALKEMGYKLELGKAIGAAERVLEGENNA